MNDPAGRNFFPVDPKPLHRLLIFPDLPNRNFDGRPDINQKP